MTSLTVSSPAPSIGIRIASTVVSVLSLLFGVVVLAMFAMIVPKFEAVFADFGTPLPAVAAITIAVSDAIRNFWYLFFGLLGGVITALVVVSLAARSRGPIIAAGCAAGVLCLFFFTTVAAMTFGLFAPLLSVMQSVQAKP
jgi:type IV pilus assembly protein PilC